MLIIQKDGVRLKGQSIADGQSACKLNGRCRPSFRTVLTVGQEEPIMTRRIKSAERNNVECKGIIRGTYQGVLSFGHENEAYAVPINHAYEDGEFYFHCAVNGKKIDFIRRNPTVVYTVMKYYGSAEDFKSRNNCHGKWESVIAYGNARYVEDEQEFQEPLNDKFLKYYPKFVVRKSMGVGHSSQTRSFAPAASLARVRFRNFCLRKRPSFLAARRFAYGITDTHGNEKFGIMVKTNVTYHGRPSWKRESSLWK